LWYFFGIVLLCTAGCDVSATIKPVDPFDLVIFGGTGDLAMRKLLPAMFRRHADAQIQPGSRIVGVAREPISAEDYRTQVRGAFAKFLDSESRTPALVESFLAMLDYRPLDATKDAGWNEFTESLRGQGERVRVFYLATAPDLFEPICARLAAGGLNKGASRVVIEKPLGRDLASANEINDAVGRSFSEPQIFRIDHYLGKETVQNLTALRFGNTLFEPLWRAEHIDHVQITVAETVGLETRGRYYDKSGALRDMVQNHMLQLLCMVAMEVPITLTADAIRDEKLKVLRSLKPIGAHNAAQLTVRGQYRSGVAESRMVPSYLEDLGSADSGTETFVAIRAEIDTWRWAGVPFYLRTGKRLAERVSEIVVHFRAVPHSIFPGSAGPLEANRLVLRLQPDEGVKLWLMIKYPGPGGLRLRHVPLDMSFAEAFGVRQPDAYERLLMDVVRGNPRLFMRRDEVEAAWNWIDPIVEAWHNAAEVPRPYPAGSWGPSAAVALIERDGRTWHDNDF
jgi:glucose-6-phosphate 1-dehydrogenase